MELCPNCSELICRIDTNQLKLLEKHGYQLKGIHHKNPDLEYMDELSLVEPSGDKIKYVEHDELSGSNVIMCGDYDREYYPILKKISQLIGEEIGGHDGGHTESYEAWLNGDDVDE